MRRKSVVAVPLVAALMMAAGAAPAAAGADLGDRLDGLGGAVVGRALPQGWRVREVRGAAPATSRVVDDAEQGKAIRFEARGQAAFFGRVLDTPLAAGAGRLSWAWKVETAVATAALRDPRRDDSPARFFVVYGTPGLLGRSRVIFYTWANEEARGAGWPSPASRRMHVMPLRNRTDATGRWHVEERDLAADYRAAFGGAPQPVTGIGFMIDTDDTGEHGVGLLGPVRWIARR